MTESDWQSTTDPERMLQFLKPQRPKRKLALFGVACARRIPRLCQEPASAAAILVSERYADRRAKVGELRASLLSAGPPPGDYGHFSRAELDRYLAEHAVLCNAASNAELVSEYALKAALDQGTEKKSQCSLLREVFGNPFRRVVLAPSHRAGTVVSLARAAYDERHLPSGELDLHRLAVLADALEETGAAGELVEHLRSPAPHVRGCWAVDLCLGLN